MCNTKDKINHTLLMEYNRLLRKSEVFGLSFFEWKLYKNKIDIHEYIVLNK